jgi:aminoglycoside 6'-N-acetyltransferase
VAIRTSPAVARWWDPPADTWPMNDSDSHRFTVWLGDRIVGFVQWYENDDPDYRHAGIDLFLDASVHGQGLGQEVVTTVLRHLVDGLGHHRVVIDPEAANVRAIACYRACGFREVGVMRRYQRDHRTGDWKDGLLLEYVTSP